MLIACWKVIPWLSSLSNKLSVYHFLSVSQEIVKEIRELEDVVGDLKYRVAQLEKRSR